MPGVIEVKYFNSYWVKKTVCNTWDANGTSTIKMAPNFTGYPFQKYDFYSEKPWLNFYTYNVNSTGTNYMATPDIKNNLDDNNWIIEEARIKGRFNNTSTDYGVKAYIVNKDYVSKIRDNKVIYSGLFNSATNTNETNVFSEATNITFTAPPEYGSIQKLYASDTKLHIFQENKVSRALIDKDAIYAADGQGSPVSTTTLVIGEINPYVGEYGISSHPQSFDYYGSKMYFSDRNRNCILRLAENGLTEISEYGMKDFFRDKLRDINNVVEFEDIETTITGQVPTWPPVSRPSSFFIYIISNSNPLNVVPAIPIGSNVLVKDFLTNEVIDLGIHVKDVTVDFATNRTNIEVSGNVPIAVIPGMTAIFRNKKRDRIVAAYDTYNDNYTISMQKSDGTYNTLTFDEKALGWVTFYDYKPRYISSLFSNFYSTTGNTLWVHNSENVDRNTFYNVTSKSSIEFIFNPSPMTVKNFKTINYEGSNGWEVESMVSDPTGSRQDVSGSWQTSEDSIATIKSYFEGRYIENGYTQRAGFDLKENRYVANLINNSTGSNKVNINEVVFGNQVTGIKGYYSTVKIQTDETTDIGQVKELFAVGTEYVLSSY